MVCKFKAPHFKDYEEPVEKLLEKSVKMSSSGENGSKCKWTTEGTSLLVNVWTAKQVQKQFEYTENPQIIWESIAKYMRKKGYMVSWKQCRSRMKHVLVCYREAKKAGTGASVEQYYDSIEKVFRSKKLDTGMDVVGENFLL